VTTGLTDKYLIIHADDRAGIAAFKAGAITSASVMLPCDWCSEVLEFAIATPQLDLGVHLTLTSEFKNIKWRPLSIDFYQRAPDNAGGYFPSTCEEILEWPDTEILAELEAQISCCRKAKITPTHLDSHMYFLRRTHRLRRLYELLGARHCLPILLPSSHDEPVLAAPTALRPISAIYDAPASLLAKDWKSYYLDTILSLQSGINLLTVHPGYDGAELRAVMEYDSPWGVAWRIRDMRIIRSRSFLSLLKQANIKLINWRQAVKLCVNEAYR
jgi:hypothetical protein